MKIGYMLSHAGGVDRNDLHFLMQRFNGRREIHAECLDGRGERVISTPDAIVVTSDGRDFERLKRKAIETLYRNHPAPG